MSTAAETLLVELGCEELPPKSLDRLADAFAAGVAEELAAAGLTDAKTGKAEVFCSPRRLAVRVAGVLAQQPDRDEERLGPAVAAAFDEAGEPKPAALGFARSCGVELAELEQLETDKGVRLALRRSVPGQPLQELIVGMLERALAKLPVPKPMRWGASQALFVRPVHWIVAMYGSEGLAGELFDQPFSTTSRGHRFLAPGPVPISHPDAYPAALKAAGVLVDRHERREEIRRQVAAQVESPDQVQLDPELLDEVNNLVEWPAALAGAFDSAFLAVPAEALVSSMQSHLRFFPVRDSSGELTPRFVGVANIESQDPAQVSRGYERVITPRLADARFFWETDLKTPLTEHQQTLAGMVYQKALGSQWDKVQRVSRLAASLSDTLGVNPASAVAAAELAKTDLLTQMVGEFPDLQGIMGRYYASAQGHPQDVCDAIEQHYLPRFAGDHLPPPGPGQVLALAERIDTLCGIFAAGLKPSGNRDPFALRRTALGLIRIMIEGELDLELRPLIDLGLAGLTDRINDAPESADEVERFVMERLRAYYADQGISTDVFEAVWARKPSRPLDFHQRVTALHQFVEDDAAAALAAANKRIGNLLRKAELESVPAVDPARFEEAAETALYEALEGVSVSARHAAEERHYDQALTQLATLRPAVDAYFDAVMVMAEDPALRENRLATLARIKAGFDDIADISLLRPAP
ncbi:MAG: glycine--tRNA ligase subunit beta [Pseudomonadota bacterium]